MSRPLEANSIGTALALFALTALAIGATWWWLGAPVAVPPSPLAAGDKLYCVSYAPFRGDQDPLDESARVTAQQIDEDLGILSHYTNCIRTYSIESGQDQIAAVAARHGMKVLQGLWLSSKPERNRRQIATVIGLAKQFPDVISAVIVGNEVLLRGDLAVTDLAAMIREVKSQVAVPVTYADVWEYWLRYADLANAVDFVTIHILPYWEDFPLPAAVAAAHVDAIRQRVAQAIPNKEIVIGEVGWPSEGRMREAALPSPSNQARVIEQTVALAQREHFRLNVIEAFDQSWKRQLEGATGGYWGIFDRRSGAPKFSFADGVSDHPGWPLQAVASIALAAVAFAAAGLAGRGETAPPYLWPRIAALSFLPCVLFGWTIERVPIDSFGVGGWLRSLAFAITAAAAPIACAAACAARQTVPAFAAVLGPAGARDGLRSALGLTLIALTLLSVQTALGLVFDPRYRDIPFAPQSAAVIPFVALLVATRRQAGRRAAAEMLAAGVLALSAVYIALNESFANWQAIWLCAGLIGLAAILLRARDAPG